VAAVFAMEDWPLLMEGARIFEERVCLDLVIIENHHDKRGRDDVA